MSRPFASVLAAVVAACAVVPIQAQVKERPIPRIVEKDGRYALFVDDAPYLMLGAQVHNSSSWPAELPKVWPAMEYLHVNTVEMPVYWEQFEPRPGVYDTALIDTLLAEARQHQVHLVILWFGTWKNGSQHYMPEWMKLDTVKYPHVIGKNGDAVDSPSPFAAASLEADKKAFSAFMRHLKTTDPERTVIMVQVENESGTWGSLRDYSPAANKLFEAPVPPEVLSAMQVKGASPAPNWQEAFGPEAEVNFHAWAVAKYVGQVAAAGKAVYPLPMYANAALRDPLKPGAPGTYESGGPTDNVLNIWKSEAPALDVLAPDNYTNDPVAYLKVLDLYHRSDNPLFVPETGGPNNPRFFFSALGLQAIGFSPFGLDYTRERAPADPSHPREEALTPWAMNYTLIGPMMRDVARFNFEGKLQAVAEEQGKATQILPFGSWNAVVSYGASNRGPAAGNPKPQGRALVAQLKDNQFLVTGYFCRVDFRPAGTEEQRKSQNIVAGTGQNPSALIDGKWQHRQFLRVEEGTYENGAFKFLRIWNGDETDYGLSFGAEPTVLRVSLATY
jgi:beta-galactosidase GanA